MMWWSTPITFVNTRVVGANGRMSRTLRVRRGRIDGIGVAPDKSDTVLDLDGAFIFPGLINAHDHLELNSQPRLKWRERYENAREWIADFQPWFDSDPQLAVTRPDTLADRVWVGGLKNLLSGVTTVCHHNPLHRQLRRRFPIRVVHRYGFSHSLHIDGPAVAQSHQTTPSDWPWMIHAAEGLDEDARGEIATLQKMGCLSRNTVLIHGVAMCDSAGEVVLRAGAGLVWCPSSNQFLFDRTADVRRFDDADRLALGSDSRLSGEGDLLDELQVAHETRQLSAEGLARTVTTGAAGLLRLCDSGELRVGAPADLAVIRGMNDDPFETLVRASRTDVCLTMVDGMPRVGEPSMAPVFAAATTATLPAVLDGTPRLVARWIGKHVAAMQITEAGFEVAL
jgi:cytosine/adenosine deaminase-related metal-dependent hydrolase